MLSNAAVEVNNDKDTTTKKKTKKDTTSTSNKKKKSSYDAWEVFKFQVREEHRVNKAFDNIEDFLQHWLNENGCKENDKLKQLYVNKRPHKKTMASKGLESFQKASRPRALVIQGGSCSRFQYRGDPTSVVSSTTAV